MTLKRSRTAPSQRSLNIIWQRPLKPQPLLYGGIHPDIDLLRRPQDHRHGLRVDLANHGICVRCEEPEKVSCDLAFLQLPHRRPRGPKSHEKGQGSAIVQREPDWLGCLTRPYMVLIESREGDHISIRDPPTTSAICSLITSIASTALNYPFNQGISHLLKLLL